MMVLLETADQQEKEDHGDQTDSKASRDQTDLMVNKESEVLKDLMEFKDQLDQWDHKVTKENLEKKVLVVLEYLVVLDIHKVLLPNACEINHLRQLTSHLPQVPGSKLKAFD